jgi:hypothetical protein
VPSVRRYYREGFDVRVWETPSNESRKKRCSKATKADDRTMGGVGKKDEIGVKMMPAGADV